MTSKTAAQRRADAIRAFKDELARLEGEGGLALTDEQKIKLEAHHAALLARFGRSFDIDRTAKQAQLSTGMRAASFLGAVALSASVFFLFRQFWGRIDTPLQVVILAGAAIGSFGATIAIHRRDPSGYFTNLAAMVAFACFVLDLSLLGQIFNLRASPDALLMWGALALVLAYQCDLPILLGAGILCIGGWIPARLATMAGVHWSQFIERPENLFVPCAAAFVLPLFVAHRDRPTFPAVYRGLGLTAALIAVLVLSNVGETSYLRGDVDWIESAYQWAGFVASAAIVGLAVRRGWNESINLGVAFFVIFLFMKFFAWWWETMPRYLFFFILGLTAVLVIMVLRRLRAAAGTVIGEQPV